MDKELNKFNLYSDLRSLFNILVTNEKVFNYYYNIASRLKINDTISDKSILAIFLSREHKNEFIKDKRRFGHTYNTPNTTDCYFCMTIDEYLKDPNIICGFVFTDIEFMDPY